jgi:hypothetical protein
MGRPQQPELARSAKTDLDPDHVETGLQGQKQPATRGETGPVPPENQPGHHPPEEQDKPDLDAFAARLGTDPKAPKATKARKAAAPRHAAKPTPAKSSSRPAATNPKKSPAAPQTRGSGGAPQKNSEVTPAKRPAAVPAPTQEEAPHLLAPQPEPDGQEEPRLVGLVLLPLRETVKRLEQLERKLTDRLATAGRGR